MENKLKEYSDFLDSINKRAYNDIYLLSNLTLSKNPYAKTKFLHNLIDDKINKQNFLKHTIFFYIRNIIYFLFLLIVYVYSRLNKDKRKVLNDSKDIILIDSFYGSSELSDGKVKKDNYFNQLYSYMEENDIEYYLIPKFYGNKNPITYINFYKIMKKDNTKSFLDISYLTYKDLLKIANFIICYPWKVLRLINSVKESRKIDLIFKEDLKYSLSGTDFYPYMRYLFGRNLSQSLLQKNIKVISWCEYQIIDKNLYKGLREGSANVTIYGTQFFIKLPTYSCLYIPESDKELNIAPDSILVAGKYYIPPKSNYTYRLGPAFRYSKIYNFEYHINKDNERIIVMLPYVQEDAFNIIQVLNDADKLIGSNIDIKIHPDFADKKNKYLMVINKNLTIIDHYPDLKDYGFVISSGSGSMMELACCGLSAIMISSKNSFTSNPMPEYGKCENWDIASNHLELVQKYRRLLDFKKSKIDKFEKNVIYYRENFLSEVNDTVIKENFDFCK